jgi:Domain of unknown function (DUF4436)
MRNLAAPDYVDDPHPRKLSKRGWTLLLLIGAAVIAVYTLVVAFYSAEGGSTFVESDNAPAVGISAVLEPISISPDESTASFRVTLSSDDQAIEDPDGRAADNIRVTVSGPEGSQEIRIPQGSAFGRAELVLGISGELASYPLDTYQGIYFITADFFSRESGGINQSRESIPVSVTTRGAVNGWDSVLTVENTAAPAAIVSVSFDRAFSTKLFAFVLLTLAFLVSVIALVISLLVFSNRRKIEVALLAWTGSLLFALPILRTYLPGAPPIGAAIDIYVFLWTIVMSFVAVFFVSASWISQKGAELEAAAHDS